MLFLDTTTRSLEILLNTAPGTQFPWTSSFTDITDTTFVPIAANGVTNSTTAVTVVAAPSSSTQRQVKFLSIHNTDTSTYTVTVRLNDNSTTRDIVVVALSAKETLEYIDSSGFQVIDANGAFKTSVTATAHGSTHAIGGSDPIDLSGSGSPNGSVTGLKGQGYLDTTNKIFYKCTSSPSGTEWMVI